jgi:hypothetical protein
MPFRHHEKDSCSRRAVGNGAANHQPEQCEHDAFDLPGEDLFVDGRANADHTPGPQIGALLQRVVRDEFLEPLHRRTNAATTMVLETEGHWCVVSL